MKLEGHNKTAKRFAARVWVEDQPARVESFEPVACSLIPSFLQGIILDGVIMKGTAATQRQRVDNCLYEQ